MSKYQVITQKTTLKAESQKKDKQISRLNVTVKDQAKTITDRNRTIAEKDRTIADRDKTIETLQKQVKDKDKALTKMYKILIAALLGLQVSPDTINDCFIVLRKVTKIIERTQQLSVDEKHDIEKKVKAKSEKLQIQTEQAKEKEREQKIQNNPNTPSSKKSPYTKKPRKDPKEHGKSGRKKGSPGSSHNVKPDQVIKHKQKKCNKCGSKDVTNKKSRQKTSINLVIIIKIITHVAYIGKCNSCGNKHDTYKTIPDILNNTMLGVVLGVIATIMRKNGCSISTIASTLQCLDPRISENMVTSAINEIGDRLEKYVKRIKKQNLKSRTAYMDETSMPLKERLGWIWVLVGDFGTQFVVAPGRTKIFLEMTFGKYLHIPLVSDGYSPYKIFDIRQRCWAHVLRYAEYVICDIHTSLMCSQLRELYEIAKELQIKDPTQARIALKGEVDDLIKRTLELAAEYKSLDIKFGIHLENAAAELYTFVTHYGMEPTNNRAERALRAFVIFRKICQHINSDKGRERLANIFTYITTLEQKNLNVYENLLADVRK